MTVVKEVTCKMDDYNRNKNSKIADFIEDLKPNDHLCFIHESREEWKETVVTFIRSGLKRGEKCIYIVDANTDDEIKTILQGVGLAVDEYETKGQLSIISERNAYTREGFFAPDLMIDMLIQKTKQALQEGYSALRIIGEMSWVLRGYRGAEKVLEYEAKLNQEIFHKYPCLSLCIYDRGRFDPKTIKEVVMTHPLLIRGDQIYSNFYCIDPEQCLDPKKEDREVQYLLNKLEYERKVQESWIQSEEKYHRLFETMAQGVIYQAADGRILSANPAAERILGITLDEMQGRTSMDPRWKMIKEDGTPVPGEEHPVMIALKTGQKVGPVTRGVFNPNKNSHIWLNIIAIPLFQWGEEEPFQAYATIEDITKRKQAEEALKRIEWMLDTEKSKGLEEIKKIPPPPYGSLTTLAPPGLIRDAVGEEVLKEIAADYLSLLETSTAVYEKNGDYALGIFSSGWCRFLDNASRELCKTDDNKEALLCGQWLCHESCWTDTSKKAIATGQPIDNPCHGGLRLYAVPIWANKEVIGAINFGYGNPPLDRDQLQEIAEKYQVDVNELAEEAKAYETRPPFIIQLAKDRLRGSAKLIGAMVESKQAEKEAKESRNLLYSVFQSIQDGISILNTDFTIREVNHTMEKWYDHAKPLVGKKCYSVYQGRSEPCDPCPSSRALKEKRVCFDIVPLMGEDKQVGWLEVYAYPLIDKTTESCTGVVEFVRNVTERKQAEEQIHYMSFHDALTELFNRYFLEEEMKRLDTVRQLPISIIMVDINGLKLINDTYGHSAGDELLKKVAAILKESCRKEDIIARWSGDEFVIMLPHTPAEKAEAVCRRIKSNCQEKYVKDVPVSIAVGYACKESVDKDLLECLREAENYMYKNKLTESRSSKSEILNALLLALGEKSQETESHIQGMQKVSRQIAEKLNLPETEQDRLELLVRLHDIGKINLSRDILSKKGPLTQEEWALIKEHPEIGYRIARATEEFSHVAEDILAHHEYWDGSGYPLGLKGNNIPLLARIVAIADAYDVMSNGRSYKKPKDMEEIKKEFIRCAGTQFDPELVDIFLSYLEG